MVLAVALTSYLIGLYGEKNDAGSVARKHFRCH